MYGFDESIRRIVNNVFNQHIMPASSVCIVIEVCDSCRRDITGIETIDTKGRKQGGKELEGQPARKVDYLIGASPKGSTGSSRNGPVRRGHL
jgi:hypothetical protein